MNNKKQTDRFRNYKKQTDRYSCGPVALHNAMVRFGLPRIPLTRLRKMCKTNKNKGTRTTALIKVGKKIGLKIKPINKFKLDHTNSFMVAMNVDIYSKEVGGHFIFIDNGFIYNLARNVPIKVEMSFLLRQAILYDTKEYKASVWRIDKCG